MATKNFKIRLSNPSKGKITKALGLITIGEAPEDIVGDPPSLLDPANLMEWECIFEAKSGSILTVAHAAEQNYEYLVFHYAPHKKGAQLTSCRFFFGQEFATNDNITYTGTNNLLAMISYRNGKFFSSTDWNPAGNGGAYIRKIMRKPYDTIKNEAVRMNPASWSLVAKDVTSFTWEKNVEYVVAIKTPLKRGGYGTMYHTGLLDDEHYKHPIDKTRPLIMVNCRQNNLGLIFRSSRHEIDPSDSIKSLNINHYGKYSIVSVYKRNYTISNVDSDLHENHWKKVAGPQGGRATFNWKEGKEYMMIGVDYDGGDEGVNAYLHLPENGLTDYNIDPGHGYAVGSGDAGWIQFHIVGGTKYLQCFDGFKINAIYERPFQIDYVSCLGAGSGPVLETDVWQNNRVAINAYEVGDSTGYKDNVFHLAVDVGINAEGVIGEDKGVISIVVLEHTSKNVLMGAQPFGVMELTRYTQRSGQVFNWSVTQTFNPNIVPTDINGQTTDSVTTTSKELKCNVTGLGVETQVLYNINVSIVDIDGNVQNINGLQIILNKTLVADGGSVYLRSDEII